MGNPAVTLLGAHREKIETLALSLDLSGLDQARVVTDPRYVEIALDSLIRNASVHDISQGHLAISTEIDDFGKGKAGVSIIVVNSMEGASPSGSEDPEDSTRCFYRKSSTRIAGRPGYGPGPSIVKAVTDAIGAPLSLRYLYNGAFEAALTFHEAGSHESV